MNHPSTFTLPDQVEQKQSSQPSSVTQQEAIYQECYIGDTPNTTADALSTRDMITRPQTSSIQEPKYQYRLYKCKDLQNLPAKDWLVKGLLGVGDIGIFFGPSGHGKTFVILNMAANISLGQCAADEFEVKRPLKVVYCAGEGSDGLKERIEAIENSLEVPDLPNLQVVFNVPQLFMEHKNTYLTSHVTKFIEEVRMQQDGSIDVMIIDTLHSACVGAKENDATDMGIVLHNIKHIAKELGCAVLLLHHTTKDGDSFRGSSALEGDVDLMVKVVKVNDTGNTGTMKCEKLKDGKNWGLKNFKLTEWGSSAYVSFSNCDDSTKTQTFKEGIISLLTKEQGKKFTAKEVSSRLNKEPNRTRDSLNELVEVGKCKKDELQHSNLYYI